MVQSPVSASPHRRSQHLPCAQLEFSLLGRPDFRHHRNGSRPVTLRIRPPSCFSERRPQGLQRAKLSLRAAKFQEYVLKHANHRESTRPATACGRARSRRAPNAITKKASELLTARRQSRGCRSPVHRRLSGAVQRGLGISEAAQAATKQGAEQQAVSCRAYGASPRRPKQFARRAPRSTAKGAQGRRSQGIAQGSRLGRPGPLRSGGDGTSAEQAEEARATAEPFTKDPFSPKPTGRSASIITASRRF